MKVTMSISVMNFINKAIHQPRLTKSTISQLFPKLWKVRDYFQFSGNLEIWSHKGEGRWWGLQVISRIPGMRGFSKKIVSLNSNSLTFIKYKKVFLFKIEMASHYLKFIFLVKEISFDCVGPNVLMFWFIFPHCETHL